MSSTFNFYDLTSQQPSNGTDFQSWGVDVGPTSNAIKPFMTDLVKVMYGFCFALSGFAVTLSVIVFVVTIRHIRERSSYVNLVLNLCTADCIVSVSTIGHYTMQYLRLDSKDRGIDNYREQALQDNSYCTQVFFEQTWTVAFYENLFTIVMMTVHHFITVRWPHWKGGVMSKHGFAVALLLTWALATVLGFLQFLFVATSSHHGGDTCRSTTPFCCQLRSYMFLNYEQNRELHRKAVHSVLVAVTILGFVVVMSVYAYLLTKSWFRWHLRRAAPRQLTSLTPSERAWKRLAATTAMLVGAFVIFWMPHLAYMNLHGLRLIPNLKAIFGEEKLHLLKVSLHSLVCLGSVVDPFIYGLRVPQVRSAFERALGLCRNHPLNSSIGQKNGAAH